MTAFVQVSAEEMELGQRSAMPTASGMESAEETRNGPGTATVLASELVLDEGTASGSTVATAQRRLERRFC